MKQVDWQQIPQIQVPWPEGPQLVGFHGKHSRMVNVKEQLAKVAERRETSKNKVATPIQMVREKLAVRRTKHGKPQ